MVSALDALERVGQLGEERRWRRDAPPRSTTAGCATAATRRWSTRSPTATRCCCWTSTSCPGCWTATRCTRRAAARRCASAARTTWATPRARLANASATWWRSARASARAGPVRLLTTLRTFGHNFNPVCFYYCFAPGGERVEAVVAQVTNTPWGERTPTCCARDGEHSVMRDTMDKAFHVSPFIGMDNHYDWRVTEPDGSCWCTSTSATTTATRSSTPRCRSSAASSRRSRLTRLLLRFPVMSLRVVFLIYWNALRLKLKGAPYFPHPETRRDDRPARPPVHLHGCSRSIKHERIEMVEHGRRIRVRRPRTRRCTRASPCTRRLVYRQLLRGSNGLAETYMDGLWDTDDLVALIRIAARNMRGMDRWRDAGTPLLHAGQRLARMVPRNDLAGSRENIAAHYDLGNELFSLFLDPSMMYSCASSSRRRPRSRRPSRPSSTGWWTRWSSGPRTTCWRSARAGARWPCTPRSARLPGDHHHDLSRAARLRAWSGCSDAGLSDRVTVLLEDYRDLEGHLLQARVDRDDRGGGLAVLRHLLPPLLRAARTRRADVPPGDHDRRPRLRGGEGVEELHQHPHLPRRLPALAGGDPPLHRRGNRPAHRAAGRHHRALRRDAAPLARGASRPAPSSRRSWATTCASGACGTSTSPTWRRASASAHRRRSDGHGQARVPRIARGSSPRLCG